MKFLSQMANQAQKYWVAIVACVMFATYVLIMLLASGQNIWFDEAYSIILAKHSVHDLVALTAVDAHPPLYYLYLKAWGSLFGWGEFALRSSSAVLGALSIGVVALIVKQAVSRKAALAVLPFVVVAPFLLRYDYEVRMYVLASLIGLVATWVLLKATTSKTKYWWPLYAVLVAVGMYTLYLTAVIWLAHVVWLALKQYQEKHSLKAVFLQPAVAAYAGAVALFAPYLPTFFYQYFHSSLPGIGSPLTLVKLDGVVGQLIDYRAEWEITPLLSVALVIVVVLFSNIGIKTWHRQSPERRQSVLLLASVIIVSLLFFACSAFFIYRYMAHVAVYWYVLLGLAAVFGWRYSRRVTLVYIILVLALLGEGVMHLNLVGNVNFERLQHPMTARVRQAADCHNPQTTVVADDPYTYIDSSYYFEDCLLVFYSKDPVDYKGGYAPLHDSPYRITSAESVKTPILVHLHWDGAQPAFVVSNSYHLVSHRVFDKQVVDIYQR